MCCRAAWRAWLRSCGLNGMTGVFGLGWLATVSWTWASIWASFGAVVV